jgi:hypothetical protein
MSVGKGNKGVRADVSALRSNTRARARGQLRIFYRGIFAHGSAGPFGAPCRNFPDVAEFTRPCRLREHFSFLSSGLSPPRPRARAKWNGEIKIRNDPHKIDLDHRRPE